MHFLKPRLLFFALLACGVGAFIWSYPHLKPINKIVSQPAVAITQSQTEPLASVPLQELSEEDSFQPILGKPKRIDISPLQIHRLVNQRKGRESVDLKTVWAALGVSDQRVY